MLRHLQEGRRFPLFAILFWALVQPLPGHPQTPAAEEYSVKAAYLYNFAKFIEWPAPLLSNERSPFNLCIIGQDPFGDALGTIMDKTVRNHPVRIHRFSEIGGDSRCQIAFFTRSESVRVTRWLKRLAGQPVLTVSDADDFASKGGMIGLVQEGPYIRFEINLAAARRANLQISSQLLKLARIVKK